MTYPFEINEKAISITVLRQTKIKLPGHLQCRHKRKKMKEQGRKNNFVANFCKHD